MIFAYAHRVVFDSSIRINSGNSDALPLPPYASKLFEEVVDCGQISNLCPMPHSRYNKTVVYWKLKAINVIFAIPDWLLCWQIDLRNPKNSPTNATDDLVDKIYSQRQKRRVRFFPCLDVYIDFS